MYGVVERSSRVVADSVNMPRDVRSWPVRGDGDIVVKFGSVVSVVSGKLSLGLRLFWVVVR